MKIINADHLMERLNKDPIGRELINDLRSQDGKKNGKRREMTQNVAICRKMPRFVAK